MDSRKTTDELNEKALDSVSGGAMDPDAELRALVMNELESLLFQSNRLRIEKAEKKEALGSLMEDFTAFINRCDWNGVKSCCERVFAACQDRFLSTKENRAVLDDLRRIAERMMSLMK